MRALHQLPRRWLVGGGAVVVAAMIAGTLAFLNGGHRTTTPVVAPTLAPTGVGTVFTIDPANSNATFTMSEIHFGQPNTVVGKTSQVAGQIRVDTADPAQSQVGTIKVDMSTLATDNGLRNNAIQNFILQTGDSGNQYATFAPTALTGLPATITIGQPVTFTILGNLTIHQVTKPETFAATVTLQSATQLTGTAQTTVKYEDFNLTIPSVPSVTGVSDAVVLAINLTANAG